MRLFTFIVISSFIFGCGDDDSSDGGVLDSGAADARVVDSGPMDAAMPDASDAEATPDVSGFDVGPVNDSGTDSGTDGGPDAGPVGPCLGLDIGTECPCADPYVCVDGRCLPGRGRPSCGGFAGAMCTTRAFPECTFSPGSDFGPCLSSEERACVCAEHRDLYSCPLRE